MQASQNRHADDLSAKSVVARWSFLHRHWWGCPMWDSLADPLMWAGAVVVLNIFLDHRMQVPLPKHQDVVQAFTANTAQEPLAEGIGSGCSVRGPQDFDAAGTSNSVEVCPILAVVVPYQERGCLPEGRCFSELLGCPFICWRSSNPEVYNPPGAELDYEEHEQRPKEQVVHRPEFDAAEEPIRSPYLRSMIVQECSPVLIGFVFCGTGPACLTHVLLDGSLAY